MTSLPLCVPQSPFEPSGVKIQAMASTSLSNETLLSIEDRVIASSLSKSEKRERRKSRRMTRESNSLALNTISTSCCDSRIR